MLSPLLCLHAGRHFIVARHVPRSKQRVRFICDLASHSLQSHVVLLLMSHAMQLNHVSLFAHMTWLQWTLTLGPMCRAIPWLQYDNHNCRFRACRA